MPLRLWRRLCSLGLAPRLVALAVLVASLAGGSVALSVISSARTAQRDEILEKHLVMSDLVASQIGEYVANILNDAIDLADRPDVRLAFAFNDFTYLELQLARWQAHRQDKVDGLAVYAMDGTLLAAARANRALVSVPNSMNAEVIHRVAATGLAGRGSPMRSPISGNPIRRLFRGGGSKGSYPRANPLTPRLLIGKSAPTSTSRSAV